MSATKLLPGWLVSRLDSPRHDRCTGLAGFIQRVYKPPTNRAEALVHRSLLDDGYLVVSGGWPDFMVITGPDEIIAVEVKGPGDSLADHQIVVLELLARAGINTYIKWPDYYEAVGDSKPWIDR